MSGQTAIVEKMKSTCGAIKYGYDLLSEGLYKFATDIFSHANAVVPLHGVENKLNLVTLAKLGALYDKLCAGEVLAYQCKRQEIMDDYLMHIKHVQKKQMDLEEKLGI